MIGPRMANKGQGEALCELQYKTALMNVLRDSPHGTQDQLSPRHSEAAGPRTLLVSVNAGLTLEGPFPSGYVIC
jgi:hypothetical protein